MVQEHSPDSKQHKKRVSKACDCCRKSKTKCDGQRPCTRCLQDNKICTYMTNKKKVDKQYSSSYVDLLETRVSILVQSMTQLLEKSKSPSEISQFINDPKLYNDQDEIDMNKVICSLISSEKLQNLSQSNHDYTIDEITNVNGGRESVVSESSTSNSNTPTSPNIPIPKRLTHHHSLQRDQETSHVHKPHHHQHSRQHYRSPTSSSSFDLTNQNNLDSLLYNDSIPNSSMPTSLSLNTDLNASDDNNSVNSSIMSPVYSINENYDPLTSLQIQDQSNANNMSNLGNKLIDGPVLDSNYGFNWEQFELNSKVKDEFQLIPELNEGINF